MPWASLVLAQTSLPPQNAPFYAASSIVNGANFHAPALAPNTIATVYGKDLAFVTKVLTQADVRGGILPYTLPGTGVKVMVGGIMAHVLYVSPGQVNFVVPADLLPGPSDIQLGVDTTFGPAVKVRLAETSPALFPLDPEFAIATRADGSLITRETPAGPGELVILYATGLGPTNPPAIAGQLVRAATPLERMNDFRVWLNGVELRREALLYAGLAPGFAGLYQINLRLPEFLDRNPEIRVGFPEQMSPAGVRLLAGQ